MKKKLNLKLLLIVTFLIGQTHAEIYTADQGLDKIKTNLVVANENKADFQKNLDVVKKNETEVAKLSQETIRQKEQVSAEIQANNESLKKIILQEKELKRLVNQEEQRIEYENKQLADLEKMMALIKQNQAKRASLITDFKAQLELINAEKKSWKNRETELRTQESQTIDAVRSLASQESHWSNQKKNFDVEHKKWVAESDKQKKISDTYQGLKEGK